MATCSASPSQRLRDTPRQHCKLKYFWLLSFRTQKFAKKPKMAYLKNGVRSALAIYMAEIRPLLGFGVWNVRFRGQTEGIRESGPIIVFGPKNLSRTSKWHISKMVSDWL